MQARHFFWMAAAMGMLLIVASIRLSPSDQKEEPKSAAAESATGAEESAATAKGEVKVAGKEQNRDVAKEPKPSRTMELDGRTYVLIDSRWYPKTKDNIYLVKGEKVYFVDNHKEEDGDDLERGPAGDPSTGRATDLIKSMKDNPVSAYSPGNIQKMMETLETAKDRMKERDAALKALSSSKE